MAEQAQLQSAESPSAAPAAASRWQGVARVLQQQLAYLLTGVGAFGLGLSIGLWLGTGVPVSSTRTPPPAGITTTSAGASAQRPAEGVPTPMPVPAPPAALADAAESTEPAGPATAVGGPQAGGAALFAPPSVPPPDAAPTATLEVALRTATVLAPDGFSAATLRASPSISAPSLTLLANGTRLEVLDGSTRADDFTWGRVRTPSGLVGWVVTIAIQ